MLSGHVERVVDDFSEAIAGTTDGDGWPVLYTAI